MATFSLKLFSTGMVYWKTKLSQESYCFLRNFLRPPIPPFYRNRYFLIFSTGNGIFLSGILPARNAEAGVYYEKPVSGTRCFEIFASYILADILNCCPSFRSFPLNMLNFFSCHNVRLTSFAYVISPF